MPPNLMDRKMPLLNRPLCALRTGQPNRDWTLRSWVSTEESCADIPQPDDGVLEMR